MNARDLLLNAAALMSLEGENEEYDRAIIELLSDTLGIQEEERYTLVKILKALR